MQLSFRDRKAYIGQGEYQSVPLDPYTSHPDQPLTEYPESVDDIFCPNCKTVKLLTKEKSDMAECPSCKGRFSKKNFGVGTDNRGLLGRETGLLSLDPGGNASSQGHSSSPSGEPSSASGGWGNGKT